MESPRIALSAAAQVGIMASLGWRSTPGSVMAPSPEDISASAKMISGDISGTSATIGSESDIDASEETGDDEERKTVLLPLDGMVLHAFRILNRHFLPVGPYAHLPAFALVGPPGETTVTGPRVDGAISSASGKGNSNRAQRQESKYSDSGDSDGGESEDDIRSPLFAATSADVATSDSSVPWS